MKKQKVKCIEYSVKNNNQGMYAIYTTPMAYIVKEYGSKAIESVKHGNIKDKKEVIEYLQSLI